jgi:carbamoylphosphate synthase small subunit
MRIVTNLDSGVYQEHYDGLFYSNGPGDPMLAQETIQQLSKVRCC